MVGVAEVTNRSEDVEEKGASTRIHNGRAIATSHTVPAKTDVLPVFDRNTGLILEPGHEDYLPEGSYVRVVFQAADAIAPGSKEKINIKYLTRERF